MTFKLLFIFGDSVISPPPPVAVASAVVTTALLLLWVRCDGRCAHSWRAQGTATLPPNSTSRLRQHCSRWAGGDGGHGAAAAPCSCLSVAPPPLALLASPATSAPEGAPSRGLVIAGKLRQLFLCHGSSVAVLLHCLLGIRLFYDKSRFLLAYFKCI